MYINPNVTPEVAARQKIERAIVRRVVKDALAAGYKLSVDDGDEFCVKYSRSAKAVVNGLMNTDEDYLHLDRFSATGERQPFEHGWVRFVYGNGGWDVIADYSATDAMEAVLAGANALAEKLEERSAR